ncbi:MAG: AarF/UbiB family protein, partial [Microcystaceae cyanobacterium]
MPQAILPPSAGMEETLIEVVDVEAQPVHVPLEHSEDIGPLSDLFPESWRYHPELITEFYRRRPLQVLGRLLSIVFPFLAFYLGLQWDSWWGKNPKNSRKRAIQLRDLLTKLGPTYIKVGQALSTRPDLVPPIYLEELTTLQDQLPSFPNEVAYQFIEEELGAEATEIYAELSEKPIAAASLGQVYKGTLKTGEKVAVKVQRP